MSSQEKIRISAEYVYVCTHPAHKSTMEILTGEELLKLGRVDEDYQVLQLCRDREMAMIFVQSALHQCLSIDPELKNVKQDLKEIYE